MPSSIMRRLPLIMLVGSLVGLAALLLLPGWAPFLMRFEHQTADWRTARFSDELVGEHPAVAVVLVSETTLEDYPYLLPADRGLLAKAIRALDQAGAKAIGLDFYFTRRTEPDKDAALVSALKDVGAKVVLGALDERGRLSARQREIQNEFIRASGRSAGYINLRTEPDGIVRFRAGPAEGSRTPQSFAALVADAVGGAALVEAPIAWLRQPGDGQSAFLTLPAEALIAGTAANAEAAKRGDLGRLKGKAVLIGGDYAYLDRHATPMSGKGKEAGPGVFVHAQDLAQRLDGRTLHELGTGAVTGLIVGIALVAALLGWLFGVRHANIIAGWTAATGFLIAADVLVFAGLRTILPFSLLLVAWVLGATAGRTAHILVMDSEKDRREGFQS